MAAGPRGGVVVAIRGPGVGVEQVTACLLCGTPAHVLSQAPGEVLVEATDLAGSGQGLRAPLVGAVELQTWRGQVLAFPRAFAYLPAAQVLLALERGGGGSLQESGGGGGGLAGVVNTTLGVINRALSSRFPLPFPGRAMSF